MSLAFPPKLEMDAARQALALQPRERYAIRFGAGESGQLIDQTRFKSTMH